MHRLGSAQLVLAEHHDTRSYLFHWSIGANAQLSSCGSAFHHEANKVWIGLEGLKLSRIRDVERQVKLSSWQRRFRKIGPRPLEWFYYRSFNMVYQTAIWHCNNPLQRKTMNISCILKLITHYFLRHTMHMRKGNFQLRLRNSHCSCVRVAASQRSVF